MEMLVFFVDPVGNRTRYFGDGIRDDTTKAGLQTFQPPRSLIYTTTVLFNATTKAFQSTVALEIW